jgi:predicted N-formylglutamate amidohydrolase
MSSASEATAPPVVEALREAGGSPFVLVCEHASNFIPPHYGRLGLPEGELRRHIAWDIGAAALARHLSAALDAPLFLSGISRLVIDANRPLHVPSSIPERSEATDIPGNRGLDAAERALRAARYFTPFHARVAAHLDARQAAGRRAVVVAVHSFTPVYLGVARPWHAGVLYAAAAGLGGALCERLAADPSLVIGDNEPYRTDRLTDYTVPVHGDDRGLPAVLLEIRQDLLGDAAGIAHWAVRLTDALRAVDRDAGPV